MLSDIGLKISQLRIILRILQNELGAKISEPEHLIKFLLGDMILRKFGEYDYYHEAGSKPDVF